MIVADEKLAQPAGGFKHFLVGKTTLGTWVASAPVSGHHGDANPHKMVLPRYTSKSSKLRMNQQWAPTSQSEYSVDARAPHSLHTCRTAEEFRFEFERSTGCVLERLADEFVSAGAPKAIFVVGSLPLGMGTSGSDVDVIVLVDDRSALREVQGSIVNSNQQMEFSNASDALLAGMFLMLKSGILIDLQVAMIPGIHLVQKRLRRRGPELTESEVRTLGRLGTGWLLWESTGYLQRHALSLNDPTLGIYCCTKHLVSALVHWRKALKAVDLEDVVLALNLGRSSVELGYLAYFASEGMPYLGAKWPAQIGHARGAAERLVRHPLLVEATRLLFPTYELTRKYALDYLRNVSDFIGSMQVLIEEKLLYRIAFKACPQLAS
jgi:hypothetical protein